MRDGDEEEAEGLWELSKEVRRWWRGRRPLVTAVREVQGGEFIQESGGGEEGEERGRQGGSG